MSLARPTEESRTAVPESDGHLVRLAWLAACAVLAVGCLCAWLGGDPAGWSWHANTWWQQPWTLWTAAFVHLSSAHLIGNLLALAALALLGHALRAGTGSALALVAAWPLGTLGLLAWPAVSRYGGASLVVHAGVAVLVVHCASRSLPRRAGQAWALVLGTGLLAKLVAERAWQQPLLFDSAWGFQVAVAAHLSGALAGLACALLAAATSAAFGRPQASAHRRGE